MRRRHAAVLIGALLVLGAVPGSASAHRGDEHKVQDVSGSSEPPVVGPHRFTPDRFRLEPRGTVRFSNDDQVEADGVDTAGPPHSWTLLTDGCVPGAEPGTAEACPFDSGVLQPGTSADVPLIGLAPGEYTYICKVGQAAELPFSLVLPPHATQVDGTWTGMVGTLTVAKP